MDDGRQNGLIVLTAYLHSQKDKLFTAEEIDLFFNKNQVFFPEANYQLLTLEYIQNEDWLAAWKKTFVPIHVTDRIVVRPTWEEYKINPGEIEIIIDPKMAFGTGHHETTAQCLKAIEKLGVKGKRILDYGCGTGIIAIAAAKLDAREVVACDIDHEAITCAMENFAYNKVDIMLVESNKFIASPPCDIIAANLSIDQIMSLYDELNQSLKTDGRIIYSGIPSDDKLRFLKFLESIPYVIIDELSGDEWVSYICRRE